ncbi:putative upf0481 protein [Quercus suber]|uniref:Upf0481 protein n=1 Tax=Quercus suber TaxID=58331 RepID=A0AAW0JWC0_QUESU|nr:putative upf0481 protein [Quercus suber]
MYSELKASESSILISHNQEWVIQISQALEEGLQDNDEGVLVSIFSVPKTLLSFKPESYIPQLVALGPYQHHRLELIEMKRYKLTSTMRLQKSKKSNSATWLTKSRKVIVACVLIIIGSWNSTKKHSLGCCPLMLPSCWSTSKPTPQKWKPRLCE